MAPALRENPPATAVGSATGGHRVTILAQWWAVVGQAQVHQVIDLCLGHIHVGIASPVVDFECAVVLGDGATGEYHVMDITTQFVGLFRGHH